MNGDLANGIYWQNAILHLKCTGKMPVDARLAVKTCLVRGRDSHFASVLLLKLAGCEFDGDVAKCVIGVRF
jgi:hypothetical protein